MPDDAVKDNKTDSDSESDDSKKPISLKRKILRTLLCIIGIVCIAIMILVIWHSARMNNRGAATPQDAVMNCAKALAKGNVYDIIRCFEKDSDEDKAFIQLVSDTAGDTDYEINVDSIIVAVTDDENKYKVTFNCTKHDTADRLIYVEALAEVKLVGEKYYMKNAEVTSIIDKGRVSEQELYVFGTENTGYMFIPSNWHATRNTPDASDIIEELTASSTHGVQVTMTAVSNTVDADDLVENLEASITDSGYEVTVDNNGTISNISCYIITAKKDAEIDIMYIFADPLQNPYLHTIELNASEDEIEDYMSCISSYQFKMS